MKKENSDITHLFRTRLANVKMEPHDDFWDKLQADLHTVPEESVAPLTVHAQQAGTHRYNWRVAAAVAALLAVGGASFAWWNFVSREERGETSVQIAERVPVTAAPTLPLTVGEEEMAAPPPVVVKEAPVAGQHTTPARSVPAKRTLLPSGVTAASHSDTSDADDETVTVSVSVTITQRVATGGQPASVTTGTSNEAEAVTAYEYVTPAPHNWALKAAVGTALGKGDFAMPFVASLTVERRLHTTFALETGVQYSYEQHEATHTLRIPLRADVTLTSSKSVDLYATAGGAAEKVLTEGTPLQYSVAAGVGIRYRINNRWGLFAEATVSHHFPNDKVVNLQTVRPTNVNLLCGIRMVY
ncbi:MAG: porin family protein [Prevotellaceae bacterium]|jgi:hypothetical protein|nr:porin family protein [Prevotellaceae bacterium]